MEQARHMAWVSAVVYFEERQRDVCWLMNTMLTTFERSRGGGGGNGGGPGGFLSFPLSLHCTGPLACPFACSLAPLTSLTPSLVGW